MSLTLDYTSMLASAVGNRCGIKESEIHSLESIFNATRTDLLERNRSGDLPFWDLPFDEEMITSVEEFAANFRGKFRNFVHLGIGGSSLGPVALHQALNHPQHNLLPDARRNGLRFFCPDNVDPDLIGGVFDVVEPSETVFNVVSKSGSTAETAAQFMIVLDMLKKHIGASWKDHLILTTDPVNGNLRQFAEEEGIASLPIDPGVGGRFTLLTPVGLLPAAITGIDIRSLCEGAAHMKEICFIDRLEQNPAALFAELLYLAQKHKGLPIHVMFAYSNRLYFVADWFRQLWAESLGKRYGLDGREVFAGPTPVKAIGATDQHSQVQLYVEGPFDKVVIFLGSKQFKHNLTIPNVGMNAPETNYLQDADLGDLLNTERRATAYALTKASRPNMTLEMDQIDPWHVGALMYLLEAATLYAGEFYGVNPLDQPGVEAGKKATYALMGREGYESQRAEIEAFEREAKRVIRI